jgi:polyisoprenoid-binding protein YceI
MKMILSAGLFAIVAVVAFVGYTTFKTPAQASAPITSAPIAQTSGSAASAESVFEIDPSASSAKFVIDEVLRGEPKTVVGATNQVAGQIAADLDDIDAAKVGTIRVNARTLTTDSDSRNRMLQNQILQTDQHEYITFTPSRLIGLPETVTVGQKVAFQMVGDLTVKGTTRETTFEVVVTPTTEDVLEGSATTTIRYADFGVSIPQVPSVTGVSDQLGVQLDFVARTA